MKIASWLAVGVSVALFGISAAIAADAPTSEPTSAPAVVAIDAAHTQAAQDMLKKAVAYLVSQQEKDGAWSLGGQFTPASTALALKALLDSGLYDAKSPEITKGFAALLKWVQKDGGIYDPKAGVINYTTACAVMALTAAKDPQYQGAIDAAVKYLRAEQITPGSESPDGKKVEADSPLVGGVNYGKNGKPDGVNVDYWLEALKSAGVSGDDPQVQAAAKFVGNLQNREESNKLAAGGPDDGGFVYSIGESKAGAAGKGLRSYGTLTYIGFKTFLYANMKRDDPRITAAYNWIRTYWGLDSNPNMPQAQSKQGLYFYYSLFAKALRMWGQPVIEDAAGVKHNWRHELVDALKQRQTKDGSWTNEADRWEEGHPLLPTVYAITALSEVLKK